MTKIPILLRSKLPEKMFELSWKIFNIYELI